MRRTHWCAALAVAMLGAGLLLACEDVLAPHADDGLGALPPGIHPYVVVHGGAMGSEVVELHFREVGIDHPIASYQGELTYDTRRLTLQDADVPVGVASAWNQVAPGQVRFAGAALDGVGERAVLTLHFRSSASVLEDGFSIHMDEVSEAAGFTNLTARVLPRAHPLRQRQPLAMPDR